MARRLHPTFADAVAIAVNPALVMALVGSLVFMLLEVFYQGDYGIRLQYIFALFVFAAVLVARISMEEGAERAAIFALPLAVVTLLALNRFVEYRGGPLAGLHWLINSALLGLVWWSAHQLTLDSTFAGNDDEPAEEGLLAAAGWERPARAPSDPTDQPTRSPADDAHGSRSTPIGPGATSSTGDDAAHRRPHPHGMWVVYFSLAALPLFGLGSILSAGGQRSGQPYVVTLFVVYLISGLALMLSTSFLGFRRYLRSRRLEMPAGIATAWIGVGCILILAITAVSILLPAPEQGMAATATSLARWAAGSSDDLQTSRWALGKDGKQEDEQPSDEHAGDQNANSQSANSENRAEDRQHQPDQQSDKEESPSGQTDREEAGRPQGDQANGSRDESQPGQPGRSPQRAESPPAEGQGSRPAEVVQDSMEQLQDTIGTVLQVAATLFRYAFFTALVLAAVILFWRQRRSVLEAVQRFIKTMRELLARWFGWQRSMVAADDRPAELTLTHPTFADFVDPFLSGAAAQVTTEELVRYSFAALEAWSRDLGNARHADETPHELAERLAWDHTDMTDGLRTLAGLYGLVAYAGLRPTAESVEPLRKLWIQIRQAADQVRAAVSAQAPGSLH